MVGALWPTLFMGLEQKRQNAGCNLEVKGPMLFQKYPKNFELGIAPREK